MGGDRLAHLRYSDAPKVAQAVVDAINGQARVLTGVSRDTSYVEFVKDGIYTVVVRGDDWRLIFPFFRYNTAAYRPVVPPLSPPPPVMSPQPNRLMQQPPENPAGGLRSFLDGLPFDVYSKIQRLLTTLAIYDFDRQMPAFLASSPIAEPSSLIPPEQRRDFSSFTDDTLYNKLVFVLRSLFPRDYPTTY